MSVSNKLAASAFVVAATLFSTTPSIASEPDQAPTMQQLNHMFFGGAHLKTLAVKHPEVFTPSFNSNSVVVPADLQKTMERLASRASCDKSEGNLVDCFIKVGTQMVVEGMGNTMPNTDKQVLDKYTDNLLERWVALKNAGYKLPALKQ